MKVSFPASTPHFGAGSCIAWSHHRDHDDYYDGVDDQDDNYDDNYDD